MACGCPTGYIFNELTQLCEKLQQSIAIVHSEIYFPNNNFCRSINNLKNGTVIYPNITPNQFPLIGQNLIVPTFKDVLNNNIIPASSILSGNLWTSGNNITNGRLNQAGIGLVTPLNTWQGWVTCISVNSGDILSVAFSAQKAFRLFINGVLAIIHQPTSLITTNEYLYIFPLVLTLGSYNFQYEALSDTANLCDDGSNNNGSFLFEIYKNVTASILASLTTPSSLTPYFAVGSVNWSPIYVTTAVLNTTEFYTGDIGQFSCNSGYLDSCSIPGANVCQTLLTVPYVNCCFNLIDCETGNVIITNTDLNIYIGKIITINEFSGCFLVNPKIDPECISSIPVTIISEFDTCDQCTKKCYKLTDCIGVAADIITDVDLSLNINKVIKIISQPNVCWLVTISDTCDNSETIIISGNFDTCSLCLALPIIPFIPLKTRRVQPGYGIGLCSVDFVEKTNCKFGNQIYTRMIKKKYGVEQCIDDEFDKYLVKKVLLDFNLVYDPNVCTPELIPDICPIEPIIIPSPVLCEPVIDVIAEIIISPINCPTVSNVSAILTYQRSPIING